MIAYSLVIICYACMLITPPTSSPSTADVVAEHRRCAPWYRTKSQPSFDGMPALLRRQVIASRFSATRPAQPDLAKIEDEALAWAYATG
ncbi:hypothetical protein SAMN05421505_11173 [Sinosporangium album]|uniref:Uncharacterized protein n=1 Tax=Sinosporangium album TaxID=504805 RepID=A0A1G7ZIN5_9ACTN|nr:hypothetical protein [Sinosporangium album]SDH08641.1 hypothetical protein SAMN05421505_11173 [Sinosporangium album]